MAEAVASGAVRLTIVALIFALAAVVAAPVSVQAQIFFAARPHPQFSVTPLFIVANVASGAPDVPVDVIFSVAIPPTRSALELEQDLFLLWPGEVVPGEVVPTDIAKTGIDLPADVSAQMAVIAEGRLPLRAQSHFETTETETIATGAPFITVVRTGGPLGLSPAATYIRIPWNPRLVNQAWLVSVRLTAKSLIKPMLATWIARTVSGSRSLVALGVNDVDSPAMFSMYYWQRDHVVPVQSPARLVINFARADRLAIDAMFPPEARRQRSPSLETTDVVSLFLKPAEGLAPQVLRVEFGYFSGLQSWGPILIPALFFALGNVAGVLVRNVAERLWRRLAGRVQLGPRRASAGDRATGAVISRDLLAAIVPGETTYDEVLRLCGPEREEREDLGTRGRKTLIYRGQRDVPRRQWASRWLATVSHWDVERHEVEIVLENDVVRDIQVRVGRTRLTQP